MLTCKDVIGLVLEYLESSMDPAVLADFERHLAGCGPCRAYLNTYRRTRDVTGQAEQVPMPAEMTERLRTFLLAELARRRT